LSGIFVTDGKNRKKTEKTEKNICKTYTHSPHRRLRKLNFKMLIFCVILQCQSWWRGVMVRRCLGPYKKKKKKGGKAKEKK